jgi:hypothetical protein
MATFGVILAALLALGMPIDHRSGARDTHGFAVVNLLVIGTLAATAVESLILAVGAVHSA